MEEEYGAMAGSAELSKRTSEYSRDREAGWRDKSERETVKGNWETLKKVKQVKVRKPPVILKNWFGEKPGDSTDSSSSSQEEDLTWNEVDRRKANLEKKIEKKNKIKEKKREICTRMRYMVGIGPILNATIEYHEKLTETEEEARKAAVVEYLQYYLSYDDDDIEALDIIETKRAAKDNIIYVVLGRVEDVKEIHVRRAASENSELITRDYIPPQMYARYLAISQRAKDLRAADSSLKTQLRWGEKDIEIYTKTKGMEDPLKQVNLQEFMDNHPLPELDTSIKWRARNHITQKNKKKLVFGQGSAGHPSMRKGRTDDLVSLVRQHSNQSYTQAKRLKTGISAASGSDTDMEDAERTA